MKQATTFLIVLLLISACKKEANKTNDAFSLTGGTWQLVLTTGGIAGIHQTPSQTGILVKYTFKDDSSYTSSKDTSSSTGWHTASTTNGTYKIRTGTSSITGLSTSFLYLDTLGGYCLMSHSNDTLGLGEDHVDGFGYAFVKQ